MKWIDLRVEPFPKSDLPKILNAHSISINRYAEVLFAHPAFSTASAAVRKAVIVSLEEIGLVNGGTLCEIRDQAMKYGFRPCPVSTGLFLRLAWKDQPESRSSVLRGTHHAPDGAVTVLSDEPERDSSFPKGLYLRKVDGKLWLRGYICDASYVFAKDDLFAFDGDHAFASVPENG